MHPITIDTLAAFPLQLEAHFAAIPTEFRHWAPASWDGVPSEPFTAIEQICHVRDIEIDGYQLRFRRTLDEINPLLVSIDSDALASERGYAATNPGAAFAAFRIARAKTVELLSGLNQEQFKRSAEFEGYGPVTLRGLVHYLCSHDQQHLAGLQWLLGKIQTAHL
ncbi:DinB superfamily protein [Collimonas sp. OK607]|uniref:DinB family protein n=1 Tax=Collimonas sp. OK607 TaxID=1798194 RepID=UPI0008E76953|nr:DinB family protein [Collimonas sp. OK607]SFB08307.1 DinB superfamily protein [Collimonas sp. OK607]